MIPKRLHLANFQSIRGPVTIDLAPVTLLFGPNSAGKSAIADAIGLIADALGANATLKHASRWLHGRDSQLRMVIGAGGWVHADPLEEVLDNLELSSLITASRHYYDHEDIPEPTLVTTLLLADVRSDEEPVFAQLDVIVELIFPDATVESLKVLIDGLPIAELRSRGRQITIWLEHPRFAEGAALGGTKGKLRELAIAIGESIGERATEFVQLAHGHLTLSNLYVPLAAAGLTDDMPASMSVAGFTARDWIMSDDMEAALDAIDFSTESAPINALQQILLGLILIPARIVGATARRMLRLGPLRDIPDAPQLVINTPPDNLKEPFVPVPVDWEKGRAAWTRLLENPTINIRSGEKSSRWVPIVDFVNSWLSSPERLDMGYEVRLADYMMVFQELLNELTLPYGYPFPGMKTRALYLWDQSANLPVRPDDVGTGVAQVVPVLVAGAGGYLWTFIEQPELHLHPRLQGQIADYFIAQLRVGRINEINIIETHSEHIALRTLRRLRETSSAGTHEGVYALTPDEVAVYYFEPKDGATTVHRLRVDSKGRFVDRWPKGFFDERAEDLFDDAC